MVKNILSTSILADDDALPIDLENLEARRDNSSDAGSNLSVENMKSVTVPRQLVPTNPNFPVAAPRSSTPNQTTPKTTQRHIRYSPFDPEFFMQEQANEKARKKRKAEEEKGKPTADTFNNASYCKPRLNKLVSHNEEFEPLIPRISVGEGMSRQAESSMNASLLDRVNSVFSPGDEIDLLHYCNSGAVLECSPLSQPNVERHILHFEDRDDNDFDEKANVLSLSSLVSPNPPHD